MMIDKDIIYCKKCYLMSQKAEPTPPLGTILGNIGGVDTIKFCNDFNSYTKELSNYFFLKVTINIYENKTFRFLIENPSTSYLINLLKFDKKIKVIVKNRLNDKVLSCIKLKDLIQIALFKFPNIMINKTVLIV
jgi:ribosomal protein L11